MSARENRVKIVLLTVGIGSFISAAWIRFAPHNFYENFPGFGRHWVSALGPYNGHLVTDYGAALLGLSAGVIAVALLPRARAVPILLMAWLVGTIPHLLYHVVATEALSTGDNIVNIALLSATVVVPAIALAWDRSIHSSPMPKAVGRSDNARIKLAPEKGLIVRAAFRSSRKELGIVSTPIAVAAHHPGLLAGYGAFEMATLKANRVDARLKHLAELRAAMVVGCEFCVDIGSAISRRDGITDDELRGLVDWRNSPHFSDTDRLVLEYTEAMTRTPVVVEDELFDRMRAQFDEAQLVELTSAIGIENYRARFDWAFGIGSDGFSEGAYCVPPDPVTALTS